MNPELEKSELEVYIKDKMGRVIFKIINQNVMVMRLPDMDEFTKKELISLYTQFTSEDAEKLRKFLDFEDDGSGDNEFCS